MATIAHFAALQGAARSRLGPRTTRLRWASQEPTKVATVAQFAAPQGAAGSRRILRDYRLRWTSQEATKMATLAQFAAPYRQGKVLLSIFSVRFV